MSATDLAHDDDDYDDDDDDDNDDLRPTFLNDCPSSFGFGVWRRRV